MSTRGMSAFDTEHARKTVAVPTIATPGGLPNPAVLQSVGVRGYDTFTGRQCGHPLLPAPMANIPASARGQQISYEICPVTSASELRGRIGVSAEASFSGFGVDASARADWSREQATNELSSYLLVKISVRNARLALSDFRLNADAMSLVGQPDFLKQFYRRYGDCFISDYVTGGEFLGLYEFHTRTASEREQVSAKVAVAGGTWSGSGEFSKAMDRLDVNTDVTLSVFINGGVGALPDFKPDAVVEFAQQFPLEVDPATGFPALYDTETMPYYRAIGFPASLDLPFTDNHRVLEALAEEMDRVRAYRFAVGSILRNPAGFGDKAIDAMLINARLREIEKTINMSAGIVADSAWQAGARSDLAADVHAELDAVAATLPEEKEIPVSSPTDVFNPQA